MLIVNPKVKEDELSMYVELPNGKFVLVGATEVYTDCRIAANTVIYEYTKNPEPHVCSQTKPCDVRLLEAWHRGISSDRPGDSSSWMGRLRQFWRDYWVRGD